MLLTITKRAHALIRKELSNIPIANAVVCLVEISAPIKVPPELRDAILAKKDESTVKEIALKSLPKDLLSRRRQLRPLIYPRDQYPESQLTEIDQIVFFFPPAIAKKMSGWELDVGEDGLVMRDASGKLIMPSR